jgi:tetratricopeptide (TPR) repeat protein
MARKKETEILLSAQDNQQVQHLLSQYHHLAQDLHGSSDQAQAEALLENINALSEPIQFALLKALSKEHESDAADVLAALNVLSPHKEVRKEARRSLIRLEGTKTYPQWTPPVVKTSAIQVNTVQPPRFWQGFVTQTRDQGEVQLILAWEQGFEYGEIRLLSFLLDFWQAGVNDAHVEIISRRRYNERVNDIRRSLADIPLVDCTLAEGKRLLEEALSINEWRGTTPHQDFRHHRSLVDTLILQPPFSEIGEDRGTTFINPELTDQETVINFLGAWSLGDFGLAYQLLSKDSPLREKLASDEWIALRRAWADEASPDRLELGFVREREISQSAIWVPGSTLSGRSPSRKEVEIGWSLEMKDTPLSGTLQEMPMGTAINKEIGRRWFWTSYTLVREQNAWRVQRGTDDGASIQRLSIAELQQKIKTFEDTIEELVQNRDQDAEAFMEELPWRLTQLMHFYDALIVRLPLDRQVSEDAYNRSIAVGNPELTMVYLERLVSRYPEHRSENLRNLGATQITYAYSDRLQSLPERRKHFLELAETTLRQAITSDNSARSHLLLAELLTSQQRNDEAESELLLARDLHPTHNDEAPLEAGLGNLAMRRERVDEAIKHFKRVAELNPSYPGIWYNLGFAHRLLQHVDEAEASYKRAITMEPNDIRVYADLIALYMNRKDEQQARNIAEQGVRANPQSAELRALFSSVLFELGELRPAQQQLAEAEKIDPQAALVQSVKEHYSQATKKK